MLSPVHNKPAPSLLLGPYPQRKINQAPGLAEAIEARIAASLLRWRLRPAQLRSPTASAEHSSMSRALEAWQNIHGGPCDADIVVAALAMRNDRTLTELADRAACEQAAALAACSMALDGLPVHMVYADVPGGEGALPELARHLGLTTATVEEGADFDTRRAAYAADIVAVSCRQLLFDYLLDQKALGSARGQIASRLRLQAPDAEGVLLPGLSCALVVDAREVLIDQAKRPVGISNPGEKAASHVDNFHREAVEIAGQMVAGEDYLFDDPYAPVITEAGCDKLDALRAHLGPLWCGRQRSQNMVLTALIAAGMEVDRDFEFRGDEVVLKRAGVELPCLNGIGPSDYRKLLGVCHNREAAAVPQPVKKRLSLQHLFPRYIHLAACGWVLNPRLAELQQVYGLTAIQGINAHKSVQPRVRVSASRPAWQRAMFEQLAALHQAGVNVLIVTPDDAAQASLQSEMAKQAWGEAICANSDTIPAVVSGLMLCCTLADALTSEGDAECSSFQHVIFAGTPGSLLDEQLLCHRFHDGSDVQLFACSSDDVFDRCPAALRALTGYSISWHKWLRRRLENGERASRDQVAAHDAYLRQALAFSGETV